MLRAKRLEMSDADRWEKSKVISARLHDCVDWRQFSYVHCFEPIIDLGEVQIVADFVDHDRLFTSRKLFGDWEIVGFRAANEIPDKFDCIIVPMLGFDHRLHRLGYGAGWYDKFLADQPQAKKIGLCFEVGRVEQIPAEAHDIKMDLIVTEDKVYSPEYTKRHGRGGR